jgi:hypothetical protein
MESRSGKTSLGDSTPQVRKQCVPFLNDHQKFRLIIQAERGSALKIELSPHSLRVYSTDPIYDNAIRAKKECAKVALGQGVLDFIKFGNGQTQPATGPCEVGDGKTAGSTDPVLTLQAFYESLPRPFPEPVGDKTAAEVNAPAWLNNAIQSARGGKLSPSYVWVTDDTRSRKC